VSSDIYRDPSEGANAKRQDLLRRRRDELATMPHAIRRVVVARTARMSAGIALALGGAALLAVTLSPTLVHALDGMLPGVQPAGAATMLSAAWLLALASYAISRARSEHRFAVAMSKYVLPGGDLDFDLQRLDHERPDEMARGMAHHREIGSAAWPVLGAALALPPLGLYVARAIAQRGWPVMAGFEQSLAAHHRAFAMYGIAGVIGAIAMTRRATRAPRASAALLGLAFMIGAVAAGMRSPMLAVFAVVPATMAVVVRRLRVERAAIAAVDPAAGSDMLTFRDVLRAIGASLRAVGRVAGRPATLRATVAIVIIGVGWQYAHRVKRAPETRAAAAAVPQMAPDRSLMLPHDPDAIAQVVEHDGEIKVDVDFDGKPVDLDHLAGLYNVPPSWRAYVDVSADGGPVKVSPFRDQQPELVSGTQHFVNVGCGDLEQIGLHVEPTTEHPYHVTLHVTVSIAPVDCQRVK
jgi:hypothetical protein